MITNRRDIDFLLYEMLNVDRLFDHPRYADYDRESIEAMLDAAQAVAEEKYLPVAAKLDANEPTFDGERVHIIPEVSDALEAYREAGLFAAAFDADVGGMQLPWSVSQAMGSFFCAANQSISSYSFLTGAAANMLNACGSDELRRTFFPKMRDGIWYGTMCLSEPHAGSSLSDIRTMATPTADGHYLISGNKMWISGGEQEISENIIHMVLARTPDAPPGVRGISLFLVPKYRVNNAGEIGPKNHIELAGLNHKMGHRGTTNTLLNFGESGPCHGYLMGEVNDGLRNMFHMMNEARIAIGLGAMAAGLGGYLYSLDYARNRPQGRHPQDKNPHSPQIPIVEHADVKRMLLAQKAYVEGAQALVYYCADLIDRQKTEPANRREIALLLEILTPVAKSWPSEFCLEANKHAIQILGGYGYTRDYPVERYYRDNRLNHIHEGTYAIHGIDMLGRKVRMHDGAALTALVAAMQKTIDEASTDPALAGQAGELKAVIEGLEETVTSVLACPDLTLALANATIFLDAIGHIIVGWMWLWQARVANRQIPNASVSDKAFYSGKLTACRYFFRYELPKVQTQLALVADLDDTCLNTRAEEFTGA